MGAVIDQQYLKKTAKVALQILFWESPSMFKVSWGAKSGSLDLALGQCQRISQAGTVLSSPELHTAPGARM